MRHKVGAFKDPELLARAFKRCGWNVVKNAKCRAWYTSKEYPYVAKNPNKHGYDLGFLIKKDGIELEGDTSMMHEDVWSALGTDFYKVKQAYTLESVSDWAKEHHGTMTSSVMENGVLEVELEVDSI